MRFRKPVARSRTVAQSGMMGRSRNVTLPVMSLLIGQEIPDEGRAKIRPDASLARVRISQKNSQGRPKWMTGNCPPMTKANTVIASAHRVTGRRHVAFTRRRMAEIRGAGVADANPENEVGNVKAPEHRTRNARHAHARIGLIDEAGEAREPRLRPTRRPRV